MHQQASEIECGRPVVDTAGIGSLLIRKIHNTVVQITKVRYETEQVSEIWIRLFPRRITIQSQNDLDSQMERMQRRRLNTKPEIYNNALKQEQPYLKSDQVQRNRT